ncbi:uncharacterized protein LOC122128551 isoform X2 [Clupea harengus]|uniref:Uncharacterized protein LOC122128551 isoform X2 n=1 Tax=Clupea harengus TaxID=7950 RepID=A0A8M1K4E9_CLUHA|nr:uncharacterized protein LOC122128551 isoform X2 [Clupea harengus]
MSSHACCSELQERSYFSLTHSMSATDGGAWPASHLTITVLQARRLRPKNRQGGSNPYVQVQLGNHSFTTQHACNTLCPVWNDAMIFALPTPQDDAMAMTLTVMHRRLLAALPDKFLGRVEIRLVDVCRDHQPGNRKWLTLESKPKQKVKDRGEMEVSFCLGNLHSYTRAHTQLSSICPASDGGWGSSRLRGSSSVQTAEKCEPIQPSCAAVPGLEQAPPSVAVHTHEPAASPECVSSSSGHESPEHAVQALSDHSSLNETTAAKNETTAAKITDGQAGDGTPPQQVNEDGHRASCYSSSGTQTSPPPALASPGKSAAGSTGDDTGQPNKLQHWLRYLLRHLQYRWGGGANRGETQPLHDPDAVPESSIRAKGISESPRGIAPGPSQFKSERLNVLCGWVDQCLGRM